MLGRQSVSVTVSVLLFVFVVQQMDSVASDWAVQSKPNFPAAALEKNTQGVVKLRVVVTKDGRADHAVIVKSSGDRDLDEAAQRGVLAWRMKHGAIKPSDISQGREVIIDFREEAAVGAIYPFGVVAFFPKVNSAEMWRSAPFPSYPMAARRFQEQGTVRLKLSIGAKGDVARVEVLQSSGYKLLDDAATRAVRLWKAHPQYAGQTGVLPIQFKIGFR